MKKLNGILILMLIVALLLASVPALATETDEAESDPISIIDLNELSSAVKQKQSITARNGRFTSGDKTIAQMHNRAGENAKGLLARDTMRKALETYNTDDTASESVPTGEMISTVAKALNDSDSPAAEDEDVVNLLISDGDNWVQYVHNPRSALGSWYMRGSHLINTNPFSSLLWGDRIIPVFPGQSQLIAVNPETGETSNAGSIEVSENEDGELEGAFTPAPEAEPKIVNAYGDGAPAYTYDTPLYLKLDGAEPIAWEYILRYQGGGTIAQQVLNEGQDILGIDSIVKGIIAGDTELNATRSMEMYIIAQYDEKKAAEITVPVTGIPRFVQADGSPLPGVISAGESISVKVLAGSSGEKGRWLIYAYDMNNNCISNDFNQLGRSATLSAGSLEIIKGYRADEMGRLEIKHTSTGSAVETVWLNQTFSPENIKKQTGAFPDGVYLENGNKIAYESLTVFILNDNDLSTNEYVTVSYARDGVMFKGFAFTDKYNMTLIQSLSIDEGVTMRKEMPRTYSITPLVGWKKDYGWQMYTEMPMDRFLNHNNMSDISFTLIVEISDKHTGEVVGRGYVNYIHNLEGTQDIAYDAKCWPCPACGNMVMENSRHDAPCGESGHFYCEDSITKAQWSKHNIHGICDKPACIGDHSLYHDGSYGEGHYACLGEDTHMCTKCRTEGIPCSQIADHTNVACGNSDHCNGNGVHDECELCNEFLCNGEEHGFGACKEAVSKAEPIRMNLGDTITLKPDVGGFNVRGNITDSYANAGSATGVVTGDKVNLRTRPGMEAPIIGEMSKGDRVDIIGHEGNWMQVYWYNERSFGYMYSKYLQPDSAESRAQDSDLTTAGAKMH